MDPDWQAKIGLGCDCGGIPGETRRRAVTVIPGTPGSARLDQVPEQGPELGSVLVEALAVGVCGTDVEIAGGLYGLAPPGKERLILGHESLGRVIDPGLSGFVEGDHLVGIVRRPDPVPCPNCAVGEWDMCSNGGYTERGIKRVDGFMADRWRIEPEYAIKVDKSPKPELVEALGATYHTGAVSELGLSPDVVVECTGVVQLIREAADAAAPGGIMCLTGVGPPAAADVGASSTLASDAVLKNLVVFGLVNANRRHYYRAAQVLARADRSWLEQLITRRVRPDAHDRALEREPDDIKVAIEFAQG